MINLIKYIFGVPRCVVDIMRPLQDMLDELHERKKWLKGERDAIARKMIDNAAETVVASNAIDKLERILVG